MGSCGSGQPNAADVPLDCALVYVDQQVAGPGLTDNSTGMRPFLRYNQLLHPLARAWHHCCCSVSCPPFSLSLPPHSYISRGLLASPLVIAFDYAGSSTWPTRTLHALAGPLYSLTSSTLITAASLADWPVRLLLRPAESALPALLSALGPVGSLATRLVAQVQGLVPGVVGVPPDAPPAWVEVTPSGVVLDERLGWMLWHLVQGYAGVQAG